MASGLTIESLYWVGWGAETWGSSWGDVEVYEQKGVGADSGSKPGRQEEIDHDVEDFYANHRARAQHLYAKPVAPVQELNDETPAAEPVTVLADPPPALADVIRHEHDDKPVEESVMVEQEVIDEARRQKDDEEALICILSQIV